MPFFEIKFRNPLSCELGTHKGTRMLPSRTVDRENPMSKKGKEDACTVVATMLGTTQYDQYSCDKRQSHQNRLEDLQAVVTELCCQHGLDVLRVTSDVGVLAHDPAGNGGDDSTVALRILLKTLNVVFGASFVSVCRYNAQRIEYPQLVREYIKRRREASPFPGQYGPTVGSYEESDDNKENVRKQQRCAQGDPLQILRQEHSVSCIPITKCVIVLGLVADSGIVLTSNTISLPNRPGRLQIHQMQLVSAERRLKAVLKHAQQQIPESHSRHLQILSLPVKIDDRALLFPAYFCEHASTVLWVCSSCSDRSILFLSVPNCRH